MLGGGGMRGRGMVMVSGRSEGMDGDACRSDDAAMENKAQRTTESSVTVDTRSGGDQKNF
jgi:hypothetical protein